MPKSQSASIKGDILIVDDTPQSLMMLMDFLTAQGHNVRPAPNGKVALVEVRATPPDLILLDVMMPDMDGYQVCQELKNNEQTRDIPVIFLSAMSHFEDKIRALEVGGVDYISKPFHMREVAARVEIHLTLHRLQKELLAKNQQLEQEVIERHQMAEDLRFMALHDRLTGLPNRTTLTRQIEKAIACRREDPNHHFAILFIDLDRFKSVNDTLGHHAGDQVLIAIARRLEQCARPDDLVARLSGDEFVVLLDNAQISEAEEVADLIQQTLNQPLQLEGHHFFITASIGIALNTTYHPHAEDLLRNADMAMYQAKAQGKARYVLFDAEQQNRQIEHWQLESDLWRALERQEFRVYYQPIAALSDGCMMGVEALVRWQHPQQGLLGPDTFLPLAEETGLIVPIGEWLLGRACAQLATWHAAGYTDLRLAVNLSARQLQQPNLPVLLKEILVENGLPESALELEITESVSMQDLDLTIINQLKAMGLKISIDDFGVGSSLNTLKALPLNAVKIDQSFVQGMLTNPGDRAIVMAMIGVARHLNLEVIAEGVETEEQLAFLQMQQCDEIQGYLFSPPLPAQEMSQLLQRGEASRLFLPLLNQSLELSIRSQMAGHVGYALADESLTILTSNSHFNHWVEGQPEELAGQFLPNVIPELVGIEADLQRLFQQPDVFTLSQIYRSPRFSVQAGGDNFGHYLDVQIERFITAGITLLVMITDVTEQARLEFELRQERNELRLVVKD